MDMKNRRISELQAELEFDSKIRLELDLLSILFHRVLCYLHVDWPFAPHQSTAGIRLGWSFSAPGNNPVCPQNIKT